MSSRLNRVRSSGRGSTCPDKTRHETEEQALEVLADWQAGVVKQLAKWEARGRTGKQPRSAPTRAYRCPHCRGWHLTSAAKHDRMEIDGKPVFEQWSHPRDAEPVEVGGEIRMHPFAANDLRSTDPHERLRLMLVSLDQRAGWRVRKSLSRLERR